MSFCPSKDIHSVYLDGELPENYKADYELHIEHCEKCRNELNQLKKVRALFEEDAKTMDLDSKFLEDSFQRLQVKMAYSKNIGKFTQKSRFRNITYMASGIAAAAVVAIALPLGLKANAASSESSAVAAAPLIQSVNSVSAVPITAVSTGSSTSANNVGFDSGRSVVVSGNIQDVVLSSENQRKNGTSFAKNVNGVDVLRPDFQDEAISIKITVPGMGDIPVTTEINVPMELVSGRR